jgi:hypothetical protein
MQSAFVINNFVFLNADSGEYNQFVTALTSYSHEGKNKNDDAPDCIAGLSTYFRSKFSIFR